MRVLAIDPGYERMGVALLERGAANKEILLYSDCVKTSAALPFHERLKILGKEIERLINEYQPDICAIETLYFTNNQKTAMRVAEVRGMIAYVGISHALPVHEYTPLEVKSAVAGDGKGDKRQVIAMVSRLIHIAKTIRHDDEYDAIAIGLTCLARERG